MLAILSIIGGCEEKIVKVEKEIIMDVKKIFGVWRPWQINKIDY